MNPVVFFILTKFILPFLVREGVMAIKDALGIGSPSDFVMWIKGLKAAPDYDIEKNGTHSVKLYSMGQENGNFNKGNT